MTLGFLGLLTGDAISSPFNEVTDVSNIKTEEAIELFVHLRGQLSFVVAQMG